MTTQNKRVLVGMSGGMDSAVTAALLKMQGYEVMGAHLQLWERGAKIPAGGNCCHAVDPDDVKKLCEKLEIPFLCLGVADLYQHECLDYSVHEYLQARVPNPCVNCSSHVKIATLIKKADELRCDFVATGHYAKIVRNAEGTESNIYRATDQSRDQSYFLFRLTQPQLARTLMPLGDLLDANVRKMAITFGLPVIDKPEFQAVCFADFTNYRQLVESRTPDRYRPGGMIVNREGHALGRHLGLHLYRVGQTRVAGIEKAENMDLFVLGFDVRLNALIVGEKKELYQPSLVATGCNWIGLQDFSRGIKAKARVRAHHHEAAECTLTLLNNNSVLVDFEKPQFAITPGQAVVFYQEDVMIGGGWIETGLPPINTKLNKRVAFTVSEAFLEPK